MESFSAIINLSNKTSGADAGIQQVREEDAIAQGNENMPIYKTNLTDLHKEMAIHDLTLPVTMNFIDINTFTLNKFSDDSNSSFDSISQDNFCLFNYFSKFTKKPETMKINDLRLSPFVLFKFLVEFFDSPSFLDKSLSEERVGLSHVIIKTFLAADKLFACETYQDLFIEIRSILNSVEDANPKVIGPIIEDCATNAIVSSFTNKYNGETIMNPCRQAIMKEMGLKRKVVDELNRKYGHMDNYISLNTYINQRAYLMNHEWISNKEENSEMFEIAQKRMETLSEKVGEMMLKKPPKGNTYINLSIKWEPKFQDSYLKNSVFFEVRYQNYISYFSPVSDTVELCIPFNSKNEIISVRLMYINEKYKHECIFTSTKEMRGVLHTFEIVTSKHDLVTMENFKKPGIISHECGAITITQQYMRRGIVDIKQSQLSPGSINLIHIIEFFTAKLVKEWVKGPRMSIEPPQELFLGLVEFGMRYAIPTSVIYVLLIRKLYACWNDSESYLQAFGALYYVTKHCLQKTKTTSTITKIFNDITEGLREKVPTALLNRFSYVGHYERSGIMPLLALFTLVIKKDDGTEVDAAKEFDEIRKNAKGSIIRSIISNIKPSTSGQMTTKEADELIQFIQKNGTSVSIDLSQGSGLQPVGLEFSLKSLAETTEEILQRSRQMRKYYEENTIPVDFNSQKEIEQDIIELTLDIVNVFKSLPIAFDDQENIFKLFFAYREIFKIYDFGPEYSPFEIFYKIVIEWIGAVSPKLLQQTQVAIDKDDFHVKDTSKFTSSSLTDLSNIFNNSYSFLEALKWNNENIVNIIETYLSTCKSCVVYYAEHMLAMINNYFPRKVVKECYSIHGLNLNEADIARAKKVDVQQIYVMANDFHLIKPSWDEFIIKIKPLMGEADLAEQLEDPIPDIDKIIHIIPSLFSSIIEKDVNAFLNDRIWVPNSQIKKIFVSKASPYVLNPDFDRKSSTFYIDLFNSTLHFIKEKAYLLKENINNDFIDMFLECFVKGLDAGMLNIFLVESPIKYKRASVIMHFIEEMLSQMYKYLHEKFEVELDKFNEWAWRSRLMINVMSRSCRDLSDILTDQYQNIKLGPIPRTAEDKANEARNIEKCMITFISCRSYTNNKTCCVVAKSCERDMLSHRFLAY